MRCWTNGPSRGCLDTAGATKTMMMSLPLLSMSRQEIELMLRVMTKADSKQVDQKGKKKIRGSCGRSVQRRRGRWGSSQPWSTEKIRGFLVVDEHKEVGGNLRGDGCEWR